VLLIRGERLDVERSWNLGAENRPITAGPALVGGRILVVVDKRELVALDPAENEPLWRFTTPGDGLVGLPASLPAGFAVADRAGRIWLLDPGTGKPRSSSGYRFAAAVAPVCAPLPMGSEQVFVVLSDGSAVIISSSELAGDSLEPTGQR
jgi:outer membrane protein assembly factor BamB